MENDSRINAQFSERGEFCELLEQLRRQQNVSGEKLCEGVCSESMLCRVKQGERTFNKMMRDRLMARLGISDERNENFLNYEDHAKWKARQDILKSVDRREISKAKELLAEYAKSEDFINAIEQQFYQAMEIQLMLYENADNADLADELEHALKLTVPRIDDRKICDLQLSLQELNLILEYEKYRHPGLLVERCDELLLYIDHSAMDDESRAKIYPKVAWYQCEALGKQEVVDYQKMWFRSDQGIEYLRSTEKMYYLWELLAVREKILEEWPKQFPEEEVRKRAGQLAHVRQESHGWKMAIEDVYSRCGLVPQMDNFCYLYRQQEIYCINEVIRCRRKMLGMSRMQLAEGICDHKTIARMEKEHTKTQMYVVRALFERLNLSGELQRMDISAGSREALDLLNELVKYANSFDLENEKKTLQELEKHLNMDIPLNRQFVKKEQAIQIWMEDKNSGENRKHVLNMMRDALECTISLENIRQSDELYLTSGERSCLYHMAFYAGFEKMNPYFDMLLKLCRQYEQNDEVEEHIGIYEWFATFTANILSNMGMYEQADALAEKVILQSIHCRRLGMISRNLNGILRNSAQLNKNKHDNAFLNEEMNEKTALKTCIALSQLCKDPLCEKSYQRRWVELIKIENNHL